MGRFITEDPIKDGNNWYAYCSNNPINFIDPTGLKKGQYGQFVLDEDEVEDTTPTMTYDDVLNAAAANANAAHDAETITAEGNGAPDSAYEGYATDSKNDDPPGNDSPEKEKKEKKKKDNSGGSNDDNAGIVSVTDGIINAQIDEAMIKQKRKEKLISMVNQNMNYLSNNISNNSTSATAVVALNKERQEALDFKLSIIGSILVDSTFNQRNKYYNEYATYHGENGHSSPGRWACAFMSSMYHVYTKLGINPLIRDLVNFASSQRYLYPYSWSDDAIIDHNFYVGSYEHLISNGMGYNNSNWSAVETPSRHNADFSILKFRTNNGFHYTAGNSKGITVFNPDPSVELLEFLKPVYFR